MELQKVIYKRLLKLQSFLFTKDLFQRALLKPFDEQYQYVLSLESPRDDIERMIFKHKCQMYYCKSISIFLDVLAFLLCPFTLVFLSLKKIPVCEKRSELILLDCVNLKEVLPTSLVVEYPNYKAVSSEKMYCLKREDIVFIFRILFKYRMPFYLLLRFMLKLSVYRYVIEKYQPLAIAVTNELSPTSVGMTCFCKSNNILHINMMHGEKLFTMNEAFCHFHRFFVFNEFYKNKFLYLKADETTEFIIHKPIKCSIDIHHFRIEKMMVDFTYYLIGFHESEIKKIGNTINLLVKKGYTVRVRPHPRFNNSSLLKQYIPTDLLEDTQIFSIEQSISSCRRVISIFSAVLYQAQELDIPIVIDDVDYEFFFNALKDKNYIVLSEKYSLLSEYV